MVRVQWIDPGVSLAVMVGGSGVEACVPQPTGARSTGPGTIEVDFGPLMHQGDCSADLHVYGWEVPLGERVPVNPSVEVTVIGAEGDGTAATVSLSPDDVLATS
jgi:hypothetical protein